MIIKINEPLFFTCLALFLLGCRALAVLLGHEEMREKRYERGALHTIGIILCIFFGFLGWIYIAALPNTRRDKRWQELQEQWNKILKERKEEGDK